MTRYYKRPKGEYHQDFKGGLYVPFAMMEKCKKCIHSFGALDSDCWYCNYGRGKCDYEKDDDIVVFEILKQTDDCFELGKRFKLNDLNIKEENND